MSFLAPIAGAVVGGLMGKGSGGGSQTASKEPWSEAAPWIKDNIKTGQDLQRYYQQNPFNSLQQTGYQNQFSDLDQFRNQTAPGLMDFANKMMTSSYQRGPRQSQMEAMQRTPQGIPQSPVAGLLGPSTQSQGPFSAAPSQSYGLLDFKQLNPFTSTDGIPPPAPAEDPKTIAQLIQEELDRRAAGQVDPYYAANGGA